MSWDEALSSGSFSDPLFVVARHTPGAISAGVCRRSGSESCRIEPWVMQRVASAALWARRLPGVVVGVPLDRETERSDD